MADEIAQENWIDPPKEKRLESTLRLFLLVGSVATYFLDSVDVVWRFIRSSSHPRLLEHICFGVAGVALCLSLALEVKAIAREQATGNKPPDSNIPKNLLRAIGIGSLLPLAGFLVLVFGELIISLIINRRKAYRIQQSAIPEAAWKVSLRRNPGLWCACISMIIFSIVLVDRVADVLFGISGLASLIAAIRHRGTT